MELKELCEKTLDLFNIKSVSELSNAMMKTCKSNNIDVISKFSNMVEDLSIDWLQMIFQYYEADRKEKKQDYTPKCLADFVGKLVGDSDVMIDMCAGSGALTIQKWNQNHETKFELYEFDEKVIPYLIFNCMLRNIEAIVFQSDVLQNEIFKTYKITKGERFGVLND